MPCNQQTLSFVLAEIMQAHSIETDAIRHALHDQVLKQNSVLQHK